MYNHGSNRVKGHNILELANQPYQLGQRQTLALAEVFNAHTTVTLHETCGDERHAFEMYDARNAMVREAAYLCAQARGFEPGRAP